jgi:esterase/lipase superfamily enzyme
MTQYMISLPKGSGLLDVGKARYMLFDDDGANERELTQARWVATFLNEFEVDAATDPKKTVRRGDALFFVHGFNVDHASAVADHVKKFRALAKAGWSGRLISFDWPSDGLTFAYLPDRARARLAAHNLVTKGIAVLQTYQTDTCLVNMHVLAHSMGAFVTQQALNWAYQDVPSSWSLGQLAFVGGDVDASVFEADTVTSKAISRYSGRFTNYYNKYDKALAISNVKRLETAPRVGRIGLPDDAPPIMAQVDCSHLFDAVYKDDLSKLDPNTTHSFYFDQDVFWQDLVLNLNGGLYRSVFPTRDHVQPESVHNRYILKPAPIAAADYRQALGRATM